MTSEREWWAVRLRTGALYNGRVYLSSERAEEVRAGIVWHSREGAEVVRLAPAPRFTEEEMAGIVALARFGSELLRIAPTLDALEALDSDDLTWIAREHARALDDDYNETPAVTAARAALAREEGT